MKNITYAIEAGSGITISRLGSYIAVPVLNWDKMLPKNNFRTEYKLERMSVETISQSWDRYIWTKKIDLETKNLHRQFWGFSELPESTS